MPIEGWSLTSDSRRIEIGEILYAGAMSASALLDLEFSEVAAPVPSPAPALLLASAAAALGGLGARGRRT